MGTRIREVSTTRAKISYYLSHEFKVSKAEMARQLGVCTSSFAKAVQDMERQENKCYFSTTSPRSEAQLE